MENKQQLKTILSNLGIKSLNAMQQQAIPTIKEQNDVLLLSPTGSGKTLAFLLPLLQLLERDKNAVQCLVIVPSRELAIQIEQVWKKMATEWKVNVCYGGHSFDTEVNNLSNPPALLIGTPGRLLDHLNQGSFTTEHITTLILDEFDKSLQLNFHEEMELILKHLLNIQKKILVSATSDIQIPDFVGTTSSLFVLDVPLEIKQEDKRLIKQVISQQKDKLDTLFQLLCSFDSESALIFSNHREATERISDYLNEKGILTGFYHGGMDQDDRERILIKFRNGSLRYLITTDLAARGLDIPEMKHVVHYHLPSTESEFTHRNGRTARMFASGTVYIINHSEEIAPDYIDDNLEILSLPKKALLPKAPDFKTLYISGGKKNKINKVDIVGFFTQKGQLAKEDIGLIEVKDFTSFVAVKLPKVKTLLQNIKDERMKGKKYKIEVAYKVKRNTEEE